MSISFLILSIFLASITFASITSEIELYYKSFHEPPPRSILNRHSEISKGDIKTGIERGEKKSIAWGITIFPYPIDQVWRGINHEEHHVDLSPVSETKIILGTPCGEIREVFMQLPIPLLDDRWWITEQRVNVDVHKKSSGTIRELSWKKISTLKSQTYIENGHIRPTGIELADSYGSWILYQMNDTETIGYYHSYVDPGGYIPAGPINNLAGGGIFDTIQAMHKYISNISPKTCHMKVP